MTTYLELRDEALARVSCTGQTLAQGVAQNALKEAMKFVAFHVRVLSLISKATFTVVSTAPTLEANAIPIGVSGFAASATFQCVDRLYIAKDAAAKTPGLPYDFYEYHNFLDLNNIPDNIRWGLNSTTGTELSPRPYTLTPSNSIWTTNIATGNVATLFYRVSPAAYADGTTPEINPLFTSILVSAAEIALKEWLREPEQMTHLWALFEAALMPDIQRYDNFVTGGRKRSHVKIHRSYRPY